MLTISNTILNSDSKSALVPFITVGYPNLKVTTEIIQLLDSEGVNAIELGIPYSDALADGPIIQESSRIALQHNITINQILDFVNELNKSIITPLIIFTYLNPILSRGIKEFIRDISKVGVKGLIIPDLPIEEADYLIAICNYYQLELILFISPGSSDMRIKEIVSKAPGCIYLVSSYGVTGVRNNLGSHLSTQLKKIKGMTNKPIMLGFGISNEKQIIDAMSLEVKVDALVIGSAFIRRLNSFSDSYKEVTEFCQKIKKAISSD